MYKNHFFDFNIFNLQVIFLVILSHFSIIVMLKVMSDTYGLFPAPITAQMFGNAGKEHMEKNSQFTKEYSLDEVMNARKIYDFMGLLECKHIILHLCFHFISSNHFLL
uniref:Uncharacterized protein n=1 Tax=Heterorhabditis bacteriophora TaxID=37862 RepID=A0A1I7W7E7_HETBA